MSAVAAGLSFELLGFAGAPVTGEVVVLELEGRFRATARRRLGTPTLLVEHPDGSRELTPAAAGTAVADPDGALWRASWALDLGVLEASSFSLAIGRQLVELPAPDLGEPEHDRDVRLAREANALRRTIDDAREAAAAALASAGQERRAREAAEAQVSQAEQAREDIARRLTSVETELTEARREHAGELLRRDERQSADADERDRHAVAVADERVAIVEAEAAEARRALKNARAETESVRRELERERERVAVLETALPRGRVTELDGEQVDDDGNGAVHERPTTRISGEEGEGAADREAAPAAARAEAAAPLDEEGADDDAPEAASTVAEPATTIAGAGRDDDDDDDDDEDKDDDEGESVRVIGTPRPRRRAASAPATPAPGTAEIGARHIERGETGASNAWLARTVAIAALAVVAVLLLLLLKL